MIFIWAIRLSIQWASWILLPCCATDMIIEVTDVTFLSAIHLVPSSWTPTHHPFIILYPLYQPRDTHVSFTPAPPSLCLLGDVKMILRPGKRFMFRTQISLGKLSLPGQFSCLAKHLKGSIRKKKIIPSSVLNVHDSELALSICHGAMLPPRLQVINWQQKVMRNEI